VSDIAAAAVTVSLDAYSVVTSATARDEVLIFSITQLFNLNFFMVDARIRRVEVEWGYIERILVRQALLVLWTM